MKILSVIAWLLSISGIVIIFGYLYHLKGDYSFGGNNPIDIEKTGQFGEYVGGFVGTLFSLSGFILLYITLKDQRDNFYIERLESNFFEMIKFHRENVASLNFNGKTGNSVFYELHKEIIEIYELISPYFSSNSLKPENIYLPEYLTKIKANSTITQRNLSLKELAKIDLAYLIFFFGMDDVGDETILNFIKDRYNSNFTDRILEHFNLIPQRLHNNGTLSEHYSKWQDIQLVDFPERLRRYRTIINNRGKFIPNEIDYYYHDDITRRFKSNQFMLGHYYRHLYQAVGYIHDDKKLSSENKTKYIRMLRSQLSTYEQYLLFFNSLSILGRIWEIEDYKNDSKAIPIENQLITRYNLIRNTSSDNVVFLLRLSRFYPKVDYEVFTLKDTDIKKERKRLNRIYSETFLSKILYRKYES